MKRLNIVAVIEYGSETGIEYLYELTRREIKIDSIVCIGDEYPERRKELLEERTGGLFKKKSFSNFFQNNIVPIYITDDINSEQCNSILNFLNPDLIVFEGSKIIRNTIFEIPKYGMLNVHLAILPYLRGCSCMEWSIIQDYPIGVTCHYLTKDVDSGEIINRFELNINTNDTYNILRTKLLYLAALSMGDAVEKILNGLTEGGAYKNNKGPWYGPLNDEEKIKYMKSKIENKTYNPKTINDGIPIKKIDIDLIKKTAIKL